MTTPQETPCPREEQLVQWLQHDLDPTTHLQVVTHLEGCAACRVVTGALLSTNAPEYLSPADADASDGTPVWEPRPAVRVGQWRLLERIGHGAMGDVYAAWDSRLDRRVAIKWVRGRGSTSGERRLWEEAQTLARLADPHVVRVLDAGTHQGRTWLAMEWVSGCTLREYVAAGPGWNAVLRVLLQVAQGLDAAHRAQVVHRDVKPENILIDDAELARVSDFGLASRGDEASRGLVGTPAYMSPEQRVGEATPLSDQYSFAVVAWEALYGYRPVGDDHSVSSLRTLFSGARAPSRFARVLRRALADDPSKRFPSMRALRQALERVADRPRRHLLLTAVGLCVATASTLLAFNWVNAHRCDGGAAAWQLLDSPARSAVIGRDPALGTALGEFSAAWVDSYRRICTATRQDHTQTPLRMEQRFTCLERLRSRAGVLLDEADPADPLSLRLALRSLAPPGDCAVIEPNETPTNQPQGEDARTLAQLEAAVELGQFERAKALVAQLEPHRERVETARVMSRVLNAKLLLATGGGETRNDLAGEALRYAVIEGNDEVALSALLNLALQSAAEPATRKEARRQLDEAHAYVSRLGATAHLEATFLRSRGAVEAITGDFEQGRADLQRALDLGEQEVPRDDRELMESVGTLAELDFALRDWEAAATLSGRAIALSDATYGPGHPTTAALYELIAQSRRAEGRLMESAAAFRSAVAIRRAIKSEPMAIVESLTALMRLQLWLGNAASARTVGREAAALLGDQGDLDVVGAVYAMMSEALLDEGRPLDAERLARTGLERARRAKGREPAPLQRALAEAMAAQADFDEAGTLLAAAKRQHEGQPGRLAVDGLSQARLLRARRAWVPALRELTKVEQLLSTDDALDEWEATVYRHVVVLERAELALAMGKPSDARALAQRELSQSLPRHTPRLWLVVAEACLALHDRAGVEAALAAVTPLLDVTPAGEQLRATATALKARLSAP